MQKSLLSLALLTLLLSGCARGISSNALPPLVPYSKEFLAKAGQEMRSIEKTHPNVTTMIIDYGRLRDMVRAGREKETSP